MLPNMLSIGQRHILISSFFFALMNVCVKAINTLPTHEIVFFRGLIALILCVVMIRRKKIPFWGTHRKLLITRGIAGTCALGLYFYTLREMPLASAVTLGSLAPIFTTLLAFVLVKEYVPIKKLFFFFVAFVGVALIKGFDPRISPLELTLSIIAGVFAAVAYNMIRLLKDKEDPLTIILYFPLFTVPMVGSYTLWHWVWPTALEWILLLGVGIFVQIAQIYMTKGYQAETAANVAYLNYVGVLFALFFGYTLFDEVLGLASILGITLLIAGVLGANQVRERSKVSS